MSNHFHVVLHINKNTLDLLSDLEIVGRWHQLYQGNLLSQKSQRGEPIQEAEWFMLNQDITKWRSRLMSISWFMRRLNETIARLANDEDQCTGYLSLSVESSKAGLITWALTSLAVLLAVTRLKRLSDLTKSPSLK